MKGSKFCGKKKNKNQWWKGKTSGEKEKTYWPRKEENPTGKEKKLIDKEREKERERETKNQTDKERGRERERKNLLTKGEREQNPIDKERKKPTDNEGEKTYWQREE